MMNDIDNLSRRVKELEDENIALKHEIENLEKELELCGRKIDYNEPITLPNYYGKKYLEIHNEVYKLRLDKLIERENSLKDEYSLLINQETNTELVLASNESIKKELDEIDNKISNKYIELENLRFNFTSAINKVTNDENKLTKETIEILSRITNLLFSKASNETIINEIGYTMNILKNTLYPINLKMVQTKNELIRTFDELNTTVQKTTIEIKKLEASKKELKTKFQDISTGYVDTMIDSINLELEKIAKSKVELKQLFDMLKDQNLKKVQDEIKHLQILEYENKNIAAEMDKMINSFQDELMKSDTISNMQLKMIVEFSELSNKLIELEENKKAYESISKEYEHLNALLTTVNNNIGEMEEYVRKVSKVISSKPEYSETVNRYEGYLTTITLLKQEIQLTSQKVNELKEQRRLKSLDPYAKATIQKLTDQIKTNESLLEKYNIDLENVTKEVENITSLEKNLKLMSVIKERKKVEGKLPVLYTQQKELVTMVSLKHDELKKLEDSLVEYENVCNRIEELKGEINH